MKMANADSVVGETYSFDAWLGIGSLGTLEFEHVSSCCGFVVESLHTLSILCGYLPVLLQFEHISSSLRGTCS